MADSDAPTSFTSTITSGIQDISALLPLLGTDQCENHVGSALTKGFIYAAASPLSIFGILGIAKAGIKTLLATVSLRSSEVTHGAEYLRDAGFTPTGESLSLIMVDSNNLDRHLAESKLDSLLKEYHLEMGEGFKVKTPWKERYLLFSLFRVLATAVIVTVVCVPLLILWMLMYPMSRINSSRMDRIFKSILRRRTQYTSLIGDIDWNTRLIAATFMMSAISICPYIYFIMSPNKLPHPLPVVFPVMRACGGFLVSVCIQILIQRRLTRIIECRLAFHRLDVDPDVRSRINDLKNNSGDHTIIWDKLNSAEICLESVQKHLQANDTSTVRGRFFGSLRPKFLSSNPQPSSDTEKGNPQQSSDTAKGDPQPSPDTEEGKDRKTFEDRVRDEMGSMSLLMWPYHVLLVAGLVGLVVGYVGCFTVVQNDPSSKGPPIWLGIEAALSVLRLFLWGSNPNFDDARPIKFLLECKSSPLVPCNYEPITGNTVQVKRSSKFIREITSYLGFMNRLNCPGFQIYFAWTRRSPKWPKPAKRVLIIAFRHEESSQDWLVSDEVSDNPDAEKKWKLSKARITLYDGPLPSPSQSSMLPSHYHGQLLNLADAEVEISEERTPDEFMSIVPAAILSYRKGILDKIGEHERIYRELGAQSLPETTETRIYSKEALWKPSAHSSSGNFVVGGKGSAATEGRKHPQSNVAGTRLPEQEIPLNISNLRTNLKKGYPSTLDRDSRLGSLDDRLLKVYTSILLQELGELELIALAGCRIWLKSIKLRDNQNLHSADVVERKHHRVEHLWPKISRRRGTVERLLGLWGHDDEGVAQLIKWKEDMLSHLDELWDSTFEKDLNIGMSEVQDILEPYLSSLRSELKQMMGRSFPTVEPDNNNLKPLRDESEFHIRLARIQEQVNSLQGEHQVCFPEDSFEFTSLDPWKPKDYTFIVHLRQGLTFLELKQTAEELKKALEGSLQPLKSRISTFKICSHPEQETWFRLLDDFLSILMDGSDDSDFVQIMFRLFFR